MQTQATFLNVGKPKSMRDSRGEFGEGASSHSPHARSQTKTGCEGPGLFTTRNKISQRHSLRKVSDKGESPHSE